MIDRTNLPDARLLLPCPFCGADAAFNTTETREEIYRPGGSPQISTELRLTFGVGCTGCGGQVSTLAGTGYATADIAAQLWNQRAHANVSDAYKAGYRVGRQHLEQKGKSNG
jgi:hypothetical protein